MRQLGRNASTPVASTPGAPNVARLVAANQATGRDRGALILTMIIAEETDAAANAKWEHYKAGTDYEALAYRDEQAQDGHIRQAGSPWEVFEQPVSPFIARFIGSHNVLAGLSGPIAVRADRSRLGVAGDGPFVTGRVTAVEYPGAMVRIALATDPGWCRTGNFTPNPWSPAIPPRWSGRNGTRMC